MVYFTQLTVTLLHMLLYMFDYFIGDQILKEIWHLHFYGSDSECLLKLCALCASFASFQSWPWQMRARMSLNVQTRAEAHREKLTLVSLLVVSYLGFTSVLY